MKRPAPAIKIIPKQDIISGQSPKIVIPQKIDKGSATYSKGATIPAFEIR